MSDFQEQLQKLKYSEMYSVTCKSETVWICKHCGAEFDSDPGAWCSDCIVGIPQGWTVNK